MSRDIVVSTVRKLGGWTSILSVLLFVFLVRSFLFEPFQIPSGSLIPTLLIGDRIIVSKFSYGYSHFSIVGSPNLFQGRVFFTSPKRGDIVVFRRPNSSEDYIKRLIGLPGDHIRMAGGRLFINGLMVPRQRIDNYNMDNMSCPQYLETLPGGVQHHIIECLDDSGPADNTGMYVVPPGHYSLMGDNRDNSLDSRFADVGYVPEENLLGRANLVLFSLKYPAWEIWKWPTTIRWERSLNGIH